MYCTYDAVGRVTRDVLGNGCFTYFAYGAPLCYFEYEYDAASRITLIRRENGDMIYGSVSLLQSGEET